MRVRAAFFVKLPIHFFNRCCMVRIVSMSLMLVYLFLGMKVVAAGPVKPLFRNGQWRAVLQRKDGHEIVFNFEVRDSAGRKILYIRNAGERLLVDDIRVQGDSVLIRLPFFESQLRAVLTPAGNLDGVWLKRGVDTYQSVAFQATYGQTARFPAEGTTTMSGRIKSGGTAGTTSGVGNVGTTGATGTAGTTGIAGNTGTTGKKGSNGKAGGVGNTGTTGKAGYPDVSGRWKAVFRAPDDKDTTLRVGEFEQKGARVTGTFLDAGGDLRYLEGVVTGDSLKLSCFDGGHAYLFTAGIRGDSLTGGQFFAGASGYEVWTADKDAGAKLPDEFSITRWRKDAGPLAFTFRDIDGQSVSLSDARFKGKVLLIQIMGSWCPNCMDETRFLSDFYKEYQPRGVEIIGLAYERSTDFERSQGSLRSFQERFGVKYPMLITGVAVGDPQRTEKTLPQLEQINNFPTTIFVNKKGDIELIHTGFSGPGTGAHYEEQKKEFYTTVDRLLGE